MYRKILLDEENMREKRGANAEKQESINANDPDLHHQKSTWHHSLHRQIASGKHPERTPASALITFTAINRSK